VNPLLFLGESMYFKRRILFEIILWAAMLYIVHRIYGIVVFVIESLTWDQFLMVLQDPSIYSLHIEIKPSTDIEKIISAVVFAPLIETFINQYFVTIMCLRRFSENISIFISGIVFGVCHYAVYSHAGVIAATFCGFVWAFLFIDKKKKHGLYFAFFYVASIHSLSNFMLLMM
jgi:hypothetical protein